MRRGFLVFSLLLLCAGAALFLLIYPLTIIQPFKPQAADDLQRALFVFRVAPWGSILCAIAAITIAAASWKSLRIAPRVAAMLLVLLTVAAAVLSRVNIFEQMFHPTGAPRFLRASETKLDGDDMLVTVAFKGEAHAYPIREMGYHHVVNDFVAGVPIVATY